MASRNTKQRKEVKDDDDDDEIKNIYDVCGIPGLFKNILKFLNVKSILKMSESCLVKNLGHASFNECVSEAISKPKQLYELYQRYGNEFEGRSALICACERGRMNDLLLFVNLHCFHKYIEMNGVKEGNMTLNEMVNQLGQDSRGFGEYTPLMAAARFEHFQLVKYLIEQVEAGLNIALSGGSNALHFAAWKNRTNTELIELLLTHMSLDNINKKSRWGYTPLGGAYHNRSPIRQEKIALLRSKGGKANCYDENGRFVGRGNGDLND